MANPKLDLVTIGIALVATYFVWKYAYSGNDIAARGRAMYARRYGF